MRCISKQSTRTATFNMRAVLLLVAVFHGALVHGEGDIRLNVYVKNYTSTDSYVLVKVFNGFVNSTSSTLQFPIEGYVYTIENTSGPVYPPFRPNSTWIAFVPSSLEHLSHSLAVSIRSAGYSAILVDDTLSTDDQVTEDKFPLVRVENASDFFVVHSTPSRVLLRVLISLPFSIAECLCSAAPSYAAVLYNLVIPTTCTVAVVCLALMCFKLAYTRYRICRRGHRGSRRMHDLPVHTPVLQLVNLEERRAAAELLGTLPLADKCETEDFGICSVCLAAVESSTDCKSLPCHHHFHPSCIDEWLVDFSFSCPVCRQDPRTLVPEVFLQA